MVWTYVILPFRSPHGNSQWCWVSFNWLIVAPLQNLKNISSYLILVTVLRSCLGTPCEWEWQVSSAIIVGALGFLWHRCLFVGVLETPGIEFWLRLKWLQGFLVSLTILARIPSVLGKTCKDFRFPWKSLQGLLVFLWKNVVFSRKSLWDICGFGGAHRIGLDSPP